MVYPIAVVGIGPGTPEYLLPVARDVVEAAEALAGGERSLALFPEHRGQRYLVTGELAPLLLRLQEWRRQLRVAVLVSGDPGFYSLLAWLRRQFAPEELRVIPGISMLQLACARLALPWQEANWVSLHGRPLAGLREHLGVGGPLVVLCDHQHSPAVVAQALTGWGYGAIPVAACRSLGYPEEEILRAPAAELSKDLGEGQWLLVLNHE